MASIEVTRADTWVGASEFTGSFQLQAWWSKADVDNANGVVVRQTHTRNFAPVQALALCRETGAWLVSHGCHKVRCVQMPEGTHPKDFAVAFEMYA